MDVRKSLRKLIVVALVLGAVSPVAPTGLTGSVLAEGEIEPPACDQPVVETLSQFNVVSAGDVAVSGTSIGGRVLAGGNASLQSWSIGDALPVDPARFDLQVNGSIAANDGQVANGSISYGAAAASTLWAPNGQIVQQPAVPDPSLLIGDVTALVGDIDAAVANATHLDANPWWTTLRFEGAHTDMNLFRIAAGELETAKAIQVKVPDGASAIVVVEGTGYATATGQLSSVQLWNGSAYGETAVPGSADDQARRRHLVWVFPDAESVEIGPNLAWEGSIIAPQAALTVATSTSVRGALVAQGVTAAGAVANYPPAAQLCVPAGAPGGPPLCDGLPATIVGTDDDDLIVGTADADVIYAGAGNDMVSGGGGDDIVCGGEGDDTVLGDAGDDQLFGGDGDDVLDGGERFDLLDGGDGIDDCIAGPDVIDCELDSSAADTTAFDQFLADVPASAPRTVNVTGFDGVRVSIDTNGGIRPHDVRIAADYEAFDEVVGMAASAVYDLTVTSEAPAFESATITIPYEPARLGAAGELTNIDGWPADLPALPIDAHQLRIHWFDPAIGLWVDAGPFQVVDTDAHTVTVTVDHFSHYAVMAPPGDIMTSLPQQTLTCTNPSGGPSDIVIAIDQSVPAQLSDPNGRRFSDATAFVNLLHLRDPDTRVAVIGYDASSQTYATLTTVDEITTIRDGISAADEVGDARPQLAQALIAARNILDTPATGRQRHIVLFSNGHTTDNLNLADDVTIEDDIIDGLATTETRVHAISPTDAGNEFGYTTSFAWSTPESLAELLSDLAAATGGTATFADGVLGAAALAELIAVDRDGDDDGVVDCLEEDGFTTNLSLLRLADPGATRANSGETFDDVFLYTDPGDPDTDDDGLPDGAELGHFVDLVQVYADRCVNSPPDPARCYSYEEYLDLGISGYFLATSYPDRPDSDLDGRNDGDEVEGYHVARVFGQFPNQQVQTYEVFTNPLDRDTDDDGLPDYAEWFNHMRGDVPDPSELKRLGLANSDEFPPFMLLQPYDYEDYLAVDDVENGKRPVVPLAFSYPFGPSELAPDDVLSYTYLWNPDIVVSYSAYDCTNLDDETGLCDAIVQASEDAAGPCLNIFDCPDHFTRVARSVKKIVETQGVFTVYADQQIGLSDRYVYNLALYECVAYGLGDCDELNPPETESGTSLEDLATILVHLAMDLPGGYRNDPCPSLDAAGGIYDIVELATDTIVYVGRTVSYRRRALEHAIRFDPTMYRLRPVEAYRTADPVWQRVLEQRRFNEVWGDVDIATARANGSTNSRRPMSMQNWTREIRGETPKQLAGQFGQNCP